MTETIETELYKGKVKIKFHPNSHRYYVNDKSVTGVTTFIGIKDKSRPLVLWAVGLYSEYLYQNLGVKLTQEIIVEGSQQHAIRKQEAADTGTKIHDWCERYIKHKLKIKGYDLPDMPEDQNVQIGVNAFLDWEKEHKVKFLSSERIVYSKKHDYIGTLDIEAMIDGKLCLVDLKSSSALYNSVRLQTAAYLKADEEESGKKYEGRWAIRLAKETEDEYIARMEAKGKSTEGYKVFEAMFLDDEKESVDKDFSAFLACKELFQWDKDTDFYYNKK